MIWFEGLLWGVQIGMSVEIVGRCFPSHLNTQYPPYDWHSNTSTVTHLPLVFVELWNLFFQGKTAVTKYQKAVKQSTPLKINIEPENDGLEDDFPFPGVYSQVPRWSSGV